MFNIRKFVVSLLCIFFALCTSTVVFAVSQVGNAPGGLSGQEWSSIQQQIEKSRYQSVVQGDGSYTSVNTAQGWRITYSPGGLTTLEPLLPGADEYFIALELKSLGYNKPSGFGKPEQLLSDESRLIYQWTDNIREIWDNSANSLEQWFEIKNRPSGFEPGQNLTLRLELNTDLSISQNGNTLNFENRISYDKLKVWDSSGKQMPASMQLKNNSLSLLVDDSSAVYPLTIDPSFQQQAYVKASNTGGIDRFGYSVAISGDTLVVGAPFEDSDATGVNGNQNNDRASQTGAAYIFTRSAGVWSQQAYLKAPYYSGRFGLSVDISVDTVVVGATFEPSPTTGVNGPRGDNSAPRSGAAYVYTRTAGTWSHQAYLKASNTDAYDDFGRSVSISGDVLVVGAPGEDSIAMGVNGDDSDDSLRSSGAAYVFNRVSGTWTQQAYIKASTPGKDDSFGWDVAISADTLVVGAILEDSNAVGVGGDEANDFAGQSGAAYVYTRSASVWSQQAYLKASNTGINDLFGYSVAISGDIVVVGSPDEDSDATAVNGNQNNESATDSGAAYIFTRNSAVWGQQAYLKASNAGSNDRFGLSVGGFGETLIVGAPAEDGSSGAAYVFSRIANTWSQQARLIASNVQLFDEFGWAVATSADTQVVGALSEDSGATGVNGNEGDASTASGAVYVFSPQVAGPANQTITGFVASPASAVVGGSSALSATASSGLTVSFTSNTPAICTVSGSTVNYLGAGTCTVTADQAGDANFNPAPQVTLNIGVGLTDQIITNFIANPSAGVVNGSATLSAIGGGSGNPVIFGSLTPLVCTVTGTTVSFAAAGACVVSADQVGNVSFNPAPQLSLNIVVNKVQQTISGFTASPLAAEVAGTSTLSATASSGLSVSFGSATPAVCTVSAATVSYLSVGTCSVTANQAGDTVYAAAPQVVLNIGVAKAEQTISSFSANPASGVVEGTATLSAIASSGLPVSFNSNTPAICTVSGTTVSFIAAGVCTTSADQAGDSGYNMAPQVVLNITVARANQLLSNFTASPDTGVVAGTSVLSASSEGGNLAAHIARNSGNKQTPGASGNPIVFGSNTPGICTVSVAIVNYLAAGTCNVTADQAGNANYNPAPQLSLDLNVTAAVASAQPPQVIPTLSNWGMLMMTLLMAGFGGYVVRRSL